MPLRTIVVTWMNDTWWHVHIMQEGSEDATFLLTYPEMLVIIRKYTKGKS